MMIANQKNKIYFTAQISKYFYTPSIGRLVNFALLTFSADPIYPFSNILKNYDRILSRICGNTIPAAENLYAFMRGDFRP